MIYIVEYMSNRPIIFFTYEFSQDYLSIFVMGKSHMECIVLNGIVAT